MEAFNQLAQGLQQPRSLTTLSLREWDALIRQARAAGLLARLHALLERSGLLDSVPEQVGSHLIGARAIADHEQRTQQWEVNRIARALGEVDMPCVLLKGAAYKVLALEFASGRLSSDVDILVPKSAIEAVEKKLLEHGWQHIKLDDYDQYFYRHWSHELPPLQHRHRGTVVDVHHTIVPPTGRLHPDPEKLLASSLLLDGTKFRVLAPTDMLLHSAAHAFQDGDLKRGLRDLVDIDGLVCHFGQAESFWRALPARAEELDLTRPLFYALRYSHLYLHTPISPELWLWLKRWQPAWPALPVMDVCVARVIAAGPGCRDWGVRMAQLGLYIRSHWLRMPPHLLVPHLFRKSLKRKKT